ncbi:MAG: SLC13 family permease [Alphaproteobacteria bacterium]
MRHWTKLIAGTALVVSFALLVMPVPDGFSSEIMRAAALLIFAVGFWATGALPVHLTAIAFFLLAVLIGAAPPLTIFAGFASTAFWLVFGGLIVGIAVERTGLGVRLADALLRLIGGSYLRIVAGVALVGLVLAFLMPSTMGRVVILVPIMAALADRLGYEPGSRGRHGIVMATALGTFMPAATILPANVANMVLTGAAETIYGVRIHYLEYLWLHFPVLGLLKWVVLVFLIAAIYGSGPQSVERAPRSSGEVPPLSRDERILAVILAAALLLWALDYWHGISPAWVALGAGLLCLLPGIALVPLEDFERRMNLASLVYVAGILGLSAVVDRSGLGKVLADGLVGLTGLAPGEDARNFATLAGLSTFLGLITTIGGVPGILTPLAAGVAEASGLRLDSVLMTQVLGFSTVILPYQLPPLVVAMQLGGVPMAMGARLTLALAAVTLIVLLPLDYGWWRLLGYVGPG